MKAKQKFKDVIDCGYGVFDAADGITIEGLVRLFHFSNINMTRDVVSDSLKERDLLSTKDDFWFHTVGLL